jgi:hypothetical protein
MEADKDCIVLYICTYQLVRVGTIFKLGRLSCII